MRRANLTRLMVVAALVTSGAALAKSYSDKTFFAPRTVLSNRAMEETMWNRLVYPSINAPSTSAIHSHVGVTAFYQESQKAADLGKYFGIGNGKNYFKVGPRTAALPAPITNGTEVINNFLIHDSGGGDASPLAGTVYLTPKQETFGVRLDYFQDVNHPFKNIFFKASMPITYVQNNMHLKLGSDSATVGAGVHAAILKAYSLYDFFKGQISDVYATNADKQTALTKAKIIGRRSVAGIADINLALGYKFHQTAKDFLFLNAGIIVPTGNRVRGEYLFEPIYGNAQHFGLTTGFDGGVSLWEGQKASATLHAAIDYRYLFEGTEDRTLALNKSFFGGDLGNLNQYYLGAYSGATSAFPAANIFTRGLRVQPGSQLEALTNLSFKCCGFVVDLGYNAFYKEEESVWLKDWTESNFGIVQRGYDMTGAVDLTDVGTVFNGKAVAKADFDMKSVTHPSQFTNKILGGLGYSFTLAKKYVSGLGLGASYEFATDNAAMENYAVWLKGTVSF